jgi:hypothetical protein
MAALGKTLMDKEHDVYSFTSLRSACKEWKANIGYDIRHITIHKANCVKLTRCLAACRHTFIGVHTVDLLVVPGSVRILREHADVLERLKGLTLTVMNQLSGKDEYTELLELAAAFHKRGMQVRFELNYVDKLLYDIFLRSFEDLIPLVKVAVFGHNFSNIIVNHKDLLLDVAATPICDQYNIQSSMFKARHIIFSQPSHIYAPNVQHDKALVNKYTIQVPSHMTYASFDAHMHRCLKPNTPINICIGDLINTKITFFKYNEGFSKCISSIVIRINNSWKYLLDFDTCFEKALLHVLYSCPSIKFLNICNMSWDYHNDNGISHVLSKVIVIANEICNRLRMPNKILIKPVGDVVLKALMPHKGDTRLFERLDFYVKDVKHKTNVSSRVQGYKKCLGLSQNEAPVNYVHLLDPQRDAYLLNVLANMQSVS